MVNIFIICSTIMKLIKNVLIIAVSITSILIINLWYCLRTWPITEKFDWNWWSEPIMDGNWIDNINEWWATFSNKLEWILHLPQKDDYTTSLGYITSLIQISINWLLWILAFIALVYMLYCGFLVFSSGSDDKNASKGKKWISTAAIALAWIGISWLIISAMIRFINLISNA